MSKLPISWLEISQSALHHNIKEFRKHLPTAGIMAVVKSNAYGHGLIKTAKIFRRAGSQWLGTANLDEALALRRAGDRGRLLVLSYFDPTELSSAIKKNIRLTVYGLSAARAISRTARRLHTIAYIHLKLDTGTSRLGLSPDNFFKTALKICRLPYLNVEGIFSHLADAENLNQYFTNLQLNHFSKTVAKLARRGIQFPLKHIACSAAAILNSKTHLDIVRPGISAYGLWSVENPSVQSKKIKPLFKLKPALSWHTKIIQVKRINKGETIGYGRTYRAPKTITIALLPVGYWEGYDRRLSNKGKVLIHGRRCPIRGNICMNLTMVDVSGVKNVRPGDKVTLIGQQGSVKITADQLAEQCGTINYEIITRINPQLPRLYIK